MWLPTAVKPEMLDQMVDISRDCLLMPFFRTVWPTAPSGVMLVNERRYILTAFKCAQVAMVLMTVGDHRRIPADTVKVTCVQPRVIFNVMYMMGVLVFFCRLAFVQDSSTLV